MDTVKRIGLAIYRNDGVRRAFWTLAQVAGGLVTVELLDVPTQYAAVVAFLLSAVKSYIAGRITATDVR